MSRKHAHRADNAPASRRYVRSVVQRARDDIISAIVHTRPAEGKMFTISTVDKHHGWDVPVQWSTGQWQYTDAIAAPTPERIERAVNG